MVLVVVSIDIVNNHQSPTISWEGKPSKSDSCFRFNIAGILSHSSSCYRHRAETYVLDECSKTLHECILAVAVQPQYRVVNLLMLAGIVDSQLRFPDSAEAVEYVYLSPV